jgi:hypothetical protein
MALEELNDVAGSSIEKVNGIAKSSIEAINGSGVTSAPSHSDVWLIIMATSRIGVSTDGQNWTISQTGHSNATANRQVAFANTGSYDEGLWVVAKGSNTMEILWSEEKVPTLVSGSWKSNNFDGGRSCRAMCYDEYNGYFLAGAKGLSAHKTIPTSSFRAGSNDAAQGEWGNSGSYSDYSDASTNYGNYTGKSIASDGAGNIMAGIQDDLIYGVHDGAHYNWSTVGANFLAAGKLVNCVAYGNSVWIVCGEGGNMKRSTDGGQNWTTPDPGFGSSNILGLAYGGAGDSAANIWVAVGNNGLMSRSTDQGANWTAMDSGHSVTMRGVAANGSGSWVACGDAGKIGYSDDDGATWTFGTGSYSGGQYDVAINRMLPLDPG